ncbi:hypothetical protein GJ496_007093 [Pomphorhynchus laevis]|nr:hypothetical protein GJ496_007093 [Pomphorhynchus laevis]
MLYISDRRYIISPSEILDSNPFSGIDSHGRPENDINNKVGPPIYCEGNDSPVQSERRSLSELEQTASPELELRRSSRCRKKNAISSGIRDGVNVVIF